MSGTALQWSSTQLLRLAAGISTRLDPRGRARFGRALGYVLHGLSSTRRAVTRDNLVRAFPEKDHRWIESVCTESYQNLGITLAELLAFGSIDNRQVRQLVHYENLDLIENAHAAGKGVILLSAHYGNWELLAYALPLFTSTPVSVIVKPQNNPYADTWLNAIRSRSGNRLIPMGQAAREIVQILRKGEAIALLADQNASPKSDIFLPLFGRPVPVYKAPAALALRFGSAIIMGFADRQEDGSYRVALQEIPADDLDNTPDGIKELTRRHLALLERTVRRRPGLWVWQHKRWKHKQQQVAGHEPIAESNTSPL